MHLRELRVLLGQRRGQALAAALRLQQVGHAQAGAGRLVGVARADAASGGADATHPAPALGRPVDALVVLEDGKMVGILSERDYARKIILKGRSSKETLVREIMTSDVIHVSPDQKVGKCLSLMTKKRIRHMPVLEKNRLVGLLTIEEIKGKV